MIIKVVKTDIITASLSIFYITYGNRRWLKKLWVIVLLLLLTIMFHHKRIMWALALPLIVNGQPKLEKYLLAVDGDRLFDRVTQYYNSADNIYILVVEWQPSRLQRMGILPTSDTLIHREFSTRGLPDNRITFLKCKKITDWEMARQLRDWLFDHSDAHVCLMCDQFGSRRKLFILRSVLGADIKRVTIHPLLHRWYDETNWWQSKRGWLGLFQSYLQLVYTCLVGEDKDNWQEWDLDRYVQRLP